MNAPNKKTASWKRKLGLALVGTVALVAVIGGGAAAVMELRPPKMRPVDVAKKFEATPARLARGRYIVEAEAHCLQCHSEHDWKTHGAPTLPGLAGAGWDVPAAENHMPGRVFASNLTSDPETGLGAISDDAVARAIREGVSHDGRALFMMPWRDFRHLSDEDVASVVTFLRTLPAVKKARETTAIAAPVRWFLKAGAQPLTEPVADTDSKDPVARGRHLAEVGHGQSCHTPVDARHQPLAGMAFAGGQDFVIEGIHYRSANITPHASGIAHYDRALFVRAMRTGNVGGRRLAPIMPWSDIAKLTDDDLAALWAYLQTVPPVAHDVERTAVELTDNTSQGDSL